MNLAEEGLELAHESDDELSFLVAEDEAPVNDARQTTVVAQPLTPDACLSHGAPYNALLNSF